MLNQLEKIFGGRDRVRLIRFFLHNQEEFFLKEEISTKLQIRPNTLRREIRFLENVSFLLKKRIQKTILIPARKRNKDPIMKKRKADGWKLNPNFEYLRPFTKIFAEDRDLNNNVFIKNFKGMGNMQFIMVTGFFMHDDEARADLLIVGDKLKKDLIERVIHKIEAEMGRELRYIIFDTAEFSYRMKMYDRLIRDIINGPKRVLLDKLGTALD